MDIDRARTFLEIVHCGSFQRAADRLHVTQTTVSARIRTLEDELGRQLFVRNRNGARLTPAGREFERFAQSFVQIWERARHQLALPPGRTGAVALGGELSLWNPLLLDWLVEMRGARPAIAVSAQVGTPDRLLEQLRTGVLDIAVLYAPPLLPGFRVELLQNEQLVLVRTPAVADDDGRPPDYIHVDWGPLFAAQHGAGTPAFREPGLLVGLGPLGLAYLLRAGGMGYFRQRTVAPHIANGTLETVEGAPRFAYPAYAVHAEATEGRPEMQAALTVLKQVVDAAGEA